MSEMSQPILEQAEKTSLNPSWFWSHVEKTDDCWLWMKAVDDFGYGFVNVYKHRDRNTKRPHKAHRLAWQLTRGPIPKGMFVLHSCDNPRCVRPDHLFLGTQSINMVDMSQKMKRPTKVKQGRFYESMKEAQRHIVLNALRTYNGKRKKAADFLGLNYPHFLRILKEALHE